MLTSRITIQILIHSKYACVNEAISFEVPEARRYSIHANVFLTPSYIVLNLETKARYPTIGVFALLEIRRVVLSNIQVPHCKTSE